MKVLSRSYGRAVRTVSLTALRMIVRIRLEALILIPRLPAYSGRRNIAGIDYVECLMRENNYLSIC
jgi:hypothetical protein